MRPDDIEATPGSLEPGEPGRLRTLLDTALAERDRPRTVRVALKAVADGAIGVPDLYLQVLAPLLSDTGTAWQRGSTRVWEEHYATATVRTIVEALTPRVLDQAAHVEKRGETALLACPPEESHDLGLRMAFDRFLLAGYDAHFLGADTPVSEICDAAAQLDATLVVLSASTHYHRVRLRGVVDELKRSLPTGTRIAAGGPAFRHDPEGAAGLVLDLAELGLPGEPLEEHGRR